MYLQQLSEICSNSLSIILDMLIETIEFILSVCTWCSLIVAFSTILLYLLCTFSSPSNISILWMNKTKKWTQNAFVQQQQRQAPISCEYKLVNAILYEQRAWQIRASGCREQRTPLVAMHGEKYLISNCHTAHNIESQHVHLD